MASKFGEVLAQQYTVASSKPIVPEWSYFHGRIENESQEAVHLVVAPVLHDGRTS